MKTYIKLIRYIAFSVVLSMFCTISFAQTSLQKAQTAVANYEYSKAIALYKDYFKTNSPKSNSIRELVNCYTMIGDTKSAESWMLKLVSSKDFSNDDILNYAKILKSNGNYSEAKTEFLKYIELEPAEKGNVSKWVESCQRAIERMNPDSLVYEVKDINSLNTKNSEFGLIRFGKGFIFTSDRKNDAEDKNNICEWTGKPYLKLYSISGNINEALSAKAVLIDSLNSECHDGQAVYDSIHKIIYFTRTKMMRVPKQPINNDPTYWRNNFDLSGYENRLEIYTAKYDKGVWKNVKPFEYNNPQYSVGHPALSPDGKILYFVSDMPGGYGGDDIYYCEAQKDGKWSAPVNAGNTINTEGKEVFPYIDKAGTLYFASDNPKGMGGLDLYYSTGSKNKWSKPINLGYPINSSKDDFSICVTEPGKSGYFSSNRDGGVGADDIYGFSLAPNKKHVLCVRALELLKNNSLVELKDAKVNINNDEGKYKKSLTPNNKGKFLDVVDLTSPYLITIKKDGYRSQSKTIKVKNSDGDTIYVDLTTKKSENIILIGETKEQDGQHALVSDAKIIMENIEDNIIDSLKSDAKGKFSLSVDFNKTYLFTVLKDGYYTQTKKITVKKEATKDSLNVESITYMMKGGILTENKTNDWIPVKDTLNMEIFLNKIIMNQSVIVENIYYDYNKWDIRPDAALILDNIVSMLKQNPNISIELSSHTDSRGADFYNYILSQKRAESAAKYIASKGINAKRITAKGYGKSKLINNCTKCTEEEYQMNRRTEFKVIKIGK